MTLVSNFGFVLGRNNVAIKHPTCFSCVRWLLSLVWSYAEAVSEKPKCSSVFLALRNAGNVEPGRKILAGRNMFRSSKDSGTFKTGCWHNCPGTF